MPSPMTNTLGQHGRPAGTAGPAAVAVGRRPVFSGWLVVPPRNKRRMATLSWRVVPSIREAPAAVVNTCSVSHASARVPMLS
jgi:hypothetical protein